MADVSGVLVPGWGAQPGLYARALPVGWEALELPTFRATRGELTAYRHWLDAELVRRGEPITLAGHSMGAALALLAAADRPQAVQRLILISPAGLPLRKPLWRSFVTSLVQVAHGWYPLSELSRALAGIAAAPRAALRLARTVHDLNLEPELVRVSATGIPCTVIGCATDRLTTPLHCRQLATLIGASYREVEAPGGHVWMLARPALLATELGD
jgi:pimeloyl-ACP methyl ester carboxylesterase